MKFVVKKSLWLSSLMLLSCCRAQPLPGQEAEEQHGVREQRQLKSSVAAAAEADVKMLAASAGNMTPASSPAMQLAGLSGLQGLSGLPGLQGLGGMSGLPINQQLQLSRYTGNYPGLIFGAGSGAAAPLLGGLPGYAGAYTDPNLGLAYGLAGLGNYAGQPQIGGFMQNALYPHQQQQQQQQQQQFGAGFGSQPGLDLSALSGILNMQGLGGAAAGLYPQAGAGVPPMGMGGFGFGADEATSNLLKRMNIHGY